jgi:hypothetical protein
MNRTEIIKGPAVVIRGAVTYYTQGEIKLKVNKETYSIPSNILGSAGKRITSKSATVSFTPQGILDTAANYFPWNIGDLGVSVFGATDTTLVIHTLSGRTLTFSASANLGVRSLHLGADKTALGEISFLCLGKLNTLDSVAASRYVVSEAAYASAAMDVTKIRTPGYHATLSVGTGEQKVDTVIEGLDGFDVNFEYEFDPDSVNAYGLVGQTLSGISAHALFKPANFTEAQILAFMKLQDTGLSDIGDDLALLGYTLTIAPVNSSAKGVTVLLYGVGFAEAELQFGLKAKRQQGVRLDASPVLDTTYKLFTITFPTFT